MLGYAKQELYKGSMYKNNKDKNVIYDNGKRVLYIKYYTRRNKDHLEIYKLILQS